MSRFAGRTTCLGKDHAIRSVNRMLAQLPGQICDIAAKDTVGFGTSNAQTSPVSGIHADDDVMCTIDGSIFNKSSLSEITGMAPHSPPTKIVAAMYKRYGFDGTLKKLDGDFSIALYDTRKLHLWLGRDRFGVRPLYYARVPDGLAFASQPWALLTDPNIAADTNPRFVAAFAGLHYRTFDNRPEESPYLDILQLPAGSYLSHSERSSAIRPYWQLTAEPDFQDSRDKLATEYRELLLNAVAQRTESGIKNAFTLSGGLDSSSVTSCAHATTGESQTAYSAVYEDKTFDESDDIHPMLDEKVRDWHPVQIGNDIDLAVEIEELVRRHNEPVATATWLSHNRLCKQAALDGISLLFGGLGGDELNAGEYEYFIFHFADLKRHQQTQILQRELETWARYHDHPLFPKSPDIGFAELARLTDARAGRCLPDQRRLERYTHTLNPDFFSDAFRNLQMIHPFDSCLKNRTYQDMFFETLPCCLRAEDRNTAAVGISQTNPFLDHRLVEFMFRVDGRHKIESGVTKILLREAMRGILPEETRTRVIKVGWNAPAHRWFSGHQLETLRDIAASKTFADLGIYDVKAVIELIDDHAAIVSSAKPRENHMMFLWQLLNLHIWLTLNKTIKRDLGAPTDNSTRLS